MRPHPLHRRRLRRRQRRVAAAVDDGVGLYADDDDFRAVGGGVEFELQLVGVALERVAAPLPARRVEAASIVARAAPPRRGRVRQPRARDRSDGRRRRLGGVGRARVRPTRVEQRPNRGAPQRHLVSAEVERADVPAVVGPLRPKVAQRVDGGGRARVERELEVIDGQPVDALVEEE